MLAAALEGAAARGVTDRLRGGAWRGASSPKNDAAETDFPVLDWAELGSFLLPEEEAVVLAD